MSFTEKAFEFMTEKIILPLIVWVVVPIIVIGLVVIPIGLVCSLNSEKQPFTCTHQPHMGACEVPVTTYYYNAATKTMMPISSPCGCVSSHGATVLQPATK